MLAENISSNIVSGSGRMVAAGNGRAAAGQGSRGPPKSISRCWLSRAQRISSPIAMMWGGGGSGGKSFMISRGEGYMTIKWCKVG